LDDLDGDGLPDALILAGAQISILHAKVVSGQVEIETLSLPVLPVAAIPGFFVHDRGWRRQIAVLDQSGAVAIVAHGGFDSRGWTKEEVKAMRDALAHRLPNPFRPAVTGPIQDGWQVIETLPAMAADNGAGRVPLLLSWRISGQGNDDVLVIDGDRGQMAVASHAHVHGDASSFTPARVSMRPYAGGTPVAALSFRVNVDAREGVMVLHQGQVAPAAMFPVPDPTFFPNRFDDITPRGTAVTCLNTTGPDNSNDCTLREAIIKANATLGADTISLQAGTYHLSIPSTTGTTDATTGHLDITDPITIVGMGTSGANATTIQADSNLADQVFLIDAAIPGVEVSQGFTTAISNLIIQGGQANQETGFSSSGGAFLWEAGTDGNGKLTLTNVNIGGATMGNSATQDGKQGDGGGLALFNTAAANPGQVTINGASVIQNNNASDKGGGIALKGAVSLNMTNTTVTGNNAVGVGDQQGGGLFLCGSACNDTPTPSEIHQSIIGTPSAPNIAGAAGKGEGGGIWTNQSLTIDGSFIQNNDGEGEGGGVAISLSNATDQVVITGSNITGNRAPGGSGGGIAVDANTNSQATVKLNFNRFFGNSVGSGGVGTGLANLGTGTTTVTVTATDNWWGCNDGPQPPTSGTSSCDVASGTGTSTCAGTTGNVAFSPWITLTNKPKDNPLVINNSTQLTASFLQDSCNATLSGSNVGALGGLGVSWANAHNGSLIPPIQSTIQSSGTATANFAVNASPTASADASVDHATVTASIAVTDFQLSMSPVAPFTGTENVGKAATVQYTVKVAAINGFNSPVQLVLPDPDPSAGVTSGACNPSQIAVGQASICTVNTQGSTPPGNYSVQPQGASGNDSQQVTAQLTVADFCMSISPSSLTANIGQQAIYTVTCSSDSKCSTFNGFSGLVNLSTSVPGATVDFGTGTDANGNHPLQCPNSTSLTVTPSGSGNFGVPVSGTNGSATRNAPTPANLNVPATQSSAVIQINGSLQMVFVCNYDGEECTQPPLEFDDAGDITLTVNGCGPISAGGWAIDAATTANGLIYFINHTACSPVTASLVSSDSSSASIRIVSNAAGPGTNYSLVVSSVGTPVSYSYPAPPDGRILGGNTCGCSYAVSAPSSMSGGK
jgi:hypothetical protein